MRDIPTEQLILELEQRAKTGEAKADLAMLREHFDVVPAPPATTVDAAVPPTAAPAPQAAAAPSSTSAPAAAPAAAQPIADKAPYVEVRTNVQGRAREMAHLAQTLLTRFYRGELTPIAGRLVEIAAEVELLEVRHVR